MSKKQITRQKKKPAGTIQNELLNFGRKLKDWDGDIEKIGNSFESVMKSSMSTYKETKDPCYLLLSFILQNIVSFMLSRSVMGKMFFQKQTEYKFPKEPVSQLGDVLINLAANINQSALVSVLVFAYQNDLIQTVPF